METTQSLDLDHAYLHTYPDYDGRPTEEAQTTLSVILSCYYIPVADLEIDTSYTNIPIDANITVSGQIKYNFVAYKKIALTLPANERVPLITTGYVDTSFTNPGPYDFALAESTVTTSDNTTIDITAKTGSGVSRLNFPTTNFYVHPDWANSVTLSVAGNISFSAAEAGSTGSKHLRAFADPGIYVDPTATLFDIDGTTHLATDVFGVAFSPGFQVVPEPSTLALLGAGAIGLLAYGWRRKRAA